MSVRGGIVMKKRFKKRFDNEEKLIEDFYDFVRHYLSMASGLNIGNILVVADHLKYALKSQLSSYVPERGRSFWGEYHGDEEVSESSADIKHRFETDLYVFTMDGVVHRQERHKVFIKTFACYAADIEWAVGSLHANDPAGRDALRVVYNEASCCEDNVRDALHAMMGGARGGAINYR